MTEKEILVAAKELIDTPVKWIKKESWFVKNIDGQKIDCYCAIGAVAHVTADNQISNDSMVAATKRFLRVNNITSIILFNDDPETTHEMVMRAFDATIESCN